MNLTTKELTAIEEQLGQEQLLIQKFKMYAQMTPVSYTHLTLPTKLEV